MPADSGQNRGHSSFTTKYNVPLPPSFRPYGNYIDEVITMRRLNTDLYYIRDDQYNVVRIADASGNIVESYDYRDFGAPLNPTTRQVLTSSAVGNPFFFTGRPFDWQTGLYNYRTRYYDPIAGRFTSRDSIGIWGDELNLGNAFAYVGNNPWSRLDPSGRVAWWLIPLIGGLANAVYNILSYQVPRHGWDIFSWEWGVLGGAFLAGATAGYFGAWAYGIAAAATGFVQGIAGVLTGVGGGCILFATEVIYTEVLEAVGEGVKAFAEALDDLPPPTFPPPGWPIVP